MPPLKPRVGEIILTVVSLRRALNKIALALASAHNIPLSITELPPLPEWMDPRPLVYVRPAQGGHTAIPLATFRNQPIETLNLLLQKVVIPIGEAASSLPFFQDKVSFETHPPWRHHDERPAYIVPEEVFIPTTAVMQREWRHRWMSARAVDSLVEHCRGVLLDLTLLSKEEAETILDSYMQATFNRPLYPAPTEAEDPEPVGLDVPLLPDHDTATAAVKDAAATSPTSPHIALNPLATPFTPRLHPGAAQQIDILDFVSRLSLASGASSVTQESIMCVLKDNSRLPAGDAAPPELRKVRRQYIDDGAEKENRAP